MRSAAGFGGMVEGETVMTRAFRNSLPAVLLLAAASAISGCATIDINHRREASVLFERMPSADVLVSEVHSYKDGDTLVVYGKVKRTAANCCDAVRGHLDMAVVGPDGSVLDALSLVYSPRNIPKVRTRSSRFMTRLPYTVPAGATLRMAYHNDHDVVKVGGNTFVCRHSAAMPGIEG